MSTSDLGGSSGPSDFGGLEGVEQRPLREFAEKAYLDYSMYVILDRALPHISDGLKPVQRRIVYGMSELNLPASVKPRKSARTVGHVLGNYHPHGDAACYEAMVLMAQPFSYRYPLVDGQGNWGSPDDPKSFAAMRYTEARLTPYADVLLGELGQGTVDWAPSYDGSEEEPSLLPARLPNVLLNGASGIAVGMATDLLPHNLREVAAACVRLLEAPKSTTAELCEHVLGPDFPSGAEIITGAEEMVRIYETGVGSVRARASYEQEGVNIIVTALPYQVSGAKVLEQVASQMNAKKLPLVEDLRDESDHENPTRLVITPRSNRVNAEELMSHLFATTDLERTYRVNMNVVGLNGRPQVKNLRQVLTEWLQYRTDTVRRRTEHRLAQVMERLHVLEGYLIAFLNIDEVIRIVRTQDDPKAALMARFGLSDAQAEAILNLRLRRLAKLEEIKIRGEQSELDTERKGLEKILGQKSRLKKLVRSEILADAERFGDPRRTQLNEREAAQALRESVMLPSEPVTVVLSERGWVRAAKGHDMDPQTLGFKSGDRFCDMDRGRTNDNAVFLDSGGRAYSLSAHSLPSARGQGEPLASRLNPPDGASFRGVMAGPGEALYLLMSDAGYGFVAKLEDLITKNKSGKAALSVPAGAKVLNPQRVNSMEEDWVAIVSSEGRMLVHALSELSVLAKGKGLKMMHIPPEKVQNREEFVMGVAVVAPNGKLTIHAGRRHLTIKWWDLEPYEGERGQRGRKLPRGLQRVDRLEVD